MNLSTDRIFEDCVNYVISEASQCNLPASEVASS